MSVSDLSPYATDGAARRSDASHRDMLRALSLFAFVAILGVLIRPTLPIDETRYLAVAWEMRHTHDWLVPHLNGHAYADKPPLLFWLINLVWLITGPSAIAARMVAPAFGALTIWLTARLAGRLYPDSPEIVGRAALILVGTFGFALFGGLTMFDTLLACSTVLGVLALTHVRPHAVGGWIGLGAALALGGFSKGPVILIHLLPLAIAAPLWRPVSWRQMLGGVAIALGVALAVISLWLIPALIGSNAEYRQAVLWTQSAGRMVNSFAHQRPFWFLIALLPILLWPWAWSPGIWQKARFTRPLVIWIGSTVVIFSMIAGKQAHYLMPVLPAFAIAFAPAMGRDKVGFRLAAILPFALAAVLIALCLGVGPSAYAMAADPVGVAVLAAALAAAAGALLWINPGSQLAGPVLAGPLVVCAVIALFLGTMGREYDAGPLAGRLAAHDAQGVGLVDGRYHGQFTFAARLTHPVQVFSVMADAQAWLNACPGRILTAQMDADAPAPDETFRFRGQTWGLWTSTSHLGKAGSCQ
ncbi:MAG: hypothetical protein DI498_03485 [Paracoccus denitrificans]|nr:MAG: hypothetical protein DI498_03485 [Paracoccus denitrificans]PZO85586.1 MAG: hypothetical protein DI633_03485 [Paracoccus denitrificans]